MLLSIYFMLNTTNSFHCGRLPIYREIFSSFFGKLKEPQFPSEISWPLYLCFQTKYPQWLGDIRGRGLVIGLEIVSDAETKAPNSPLAVNIMYNLKAEKVLVGISGKQKNVIFISPPLCFTIENSRRYVTYILLKPNYFKKQHFSFFNVLLLK